MDDALTEEQRFPLLTAKGRRMLRWLQEHPHALPGQPVVRGPVRGLEEGVVALGDRVEEPGAHPAPIRRRPARHRRSSA